MQKYIIYISFLFASLLHFQAVYSQDTTDSTEEDGIVDPDYKPLTRAGNTVNGKWYGIGNVITKSYTNSYLCELLLKEDRKGNVTGYFNYFFRDGYFSNKLYGTYNKTTQVFKFKPVILLFHQTVKANIGVDVPMYGSFILNLNSKDTTLTGFLTPVNNYKYLVPVINVKLSIIGKNEPTLKERIRLRKLELEEDPDVATVLKEQTTGTTAAKGNTKKKTTTSSLPDRNKKYGADSLKGQKPYPPARDLPLDADKGPYQKDSIKALQTFDKYRDTVKIKERQQVYGRDTLKLADNPHIIKGHDEIQVNDRVRAMQEQIEEAYHHRANTVANSLIVKDDSVSVTLYDNGEYDRDSVSVFFNGKMIASHIELKTNAPATFVIHLDTAPGAKNELTLFAENLGSLPPNSALMIITDSHDARYEVNLKSDLSHNVSVLLVPRLK